MDPNQTNQNPTPANDGGMGMPAVDPNAGMQVPPAEPAMPTTPPAEPVEPVAPAMPEPVAPEAPVAPVEPVMPQGGDMGGGQMPPTTPPTV